MDMSNIDLLKVVDVEYVKDFTISLEFNDGKWKTIDFSPLLEGKMYEPLKKQGEFHTVLANKLEIRMVQWSGFCVRISL